MSYRFASLSSGLLARKGAAQPAMASHSGGNPRLMREDALTPMARSPQPDQRPLSQPVRETPFRPVEALEKAGYAFETAPPPFPPPQPVVPRVMPASLFQSPPLARAPVKAEAANLSLPQQAAPMTMDGCGATGACSIADPSVGDPARRFHVSVRLRQGHFVRLKIASAQLRKPSQDIVAEALSDYFRKLDPNLFGDCACSREG
jgi:hypothetical protein